MSATCSRAWQAEALHDGRLSKQHAASFERHAATCAACRREIEALEQLEATAKRLPVLISTPLEHHRLSQQVLRSANAASPRAPRVAKPVWAVAGALALVVAYVFLERTPTSQSVARDVAVAPAYEASAAPDAVWHTQGGSPVLHLTLERGRLELGVAKLQKAQRFIVQLPDGELEVKGTRFVVQADGTRTTAVRVIEGLVALRLRDRAEQLLVAGDSFEANEVESAAAMAPAVEASSGARPAPVANASDAIRSNAAHGREHNPRTKISARVPLTEAPAAPPPTETTFARAMAAFEAGDFGRADVLFEQFEREQPYDSRVEDALLLRALARARRGDESGARALARAFLDRFPNGLRTSEAERLAR